MTAGTNCPTISSDLKIVKALNEKICIYHKYADEVFSLYKEFSNSILPVTKINKLIKNTRIKITLKMNYVQAQTFVRWKIHVS